MNNSIKQNTESDTDLERDESISLEEFVTVERLKKLNICLVEYIERLHAKREQERALYMVAGVVIWHVSYNIGYYGAKFIFDHLSKK